MEKVILAAFNKNSHLIYSNNYLTKWMYKSLSQLFYCFSEENLSINLIEKLLTNSIKCLNNYCSFYKNSIDLMLINSWLNMVAYIPLLILDQIIIETLTILKKFIINFNEEIEYLLILQIILRGCDLQFSNEERKIKFIQLSKSIIRRMFEQKDWCLHFVGLWMMVNH
ncbi:hypothetical protein K502DRAFT_208387 [Neoconidiobolus thromboides FSU 785]|nr:hypothetical protein K502DRAFT_208387 [Neoconidiobolus thromboides FSU 785]